MFLCTNKAIKNGDFIKSQKVLHQFVVQCGEIENRNLTTSFEVLYAFLAGEESINLVESSLPGHLKNHERLPLIENPEVKFQQSSQQCFTYDTCIVYLCQPRSNQMYLGYLIFINNIIPGMKGIHQHSDIHLVISALIYIHIYDTFHSPFFFVILQNIFDKCHMSEENLNLYLHQNFLDFFEDIDHVVSSRVFALHELITIALTSGGSKVCQNILQMLI